MKLTTGKIVKATFGDTRMPTPQILGFVPSESMTREQYTHKLAHENFVDTMKGVAAVDVAAVAGLGLAKGLMFAADKTGKRAFNIAALVAATASGLASTFGVSKVVCDGIDRDTDIRTGKWSMPDNIRVWKQVSADEATQVASMMAHLHYNYEEDGPISLEELQTKRVGQVIDVMTEAGMYADYDHVRTLIETEQYQQLEMLVDAAKLIISTKEESEHYQKVAAANCTLSEERRVDNDAPVQTSTDGTDIPDAEADPEW